MIMLSNIVLLFSTSLLGSTYAFLAHRTQQTPSYRLVFQQTSSFGDNINSNQWREVLTDEACQDIAQEVASRIELPFYCPPPIITFATSSVVDVIANNLSPELVRTIGDAVNLGDATEQLQSLSQQLAAELNTQVDLPMLDESQEQVVLEKLSIAVVKVLASAEIIQVDPKAWVDRSVETAQTLLGEEEGRRKLAELLNQKLDFPFLDETAEEELLLKALDSCAVHLTEVLPPGLIGVLRGHGPKGLDSTKAFLVEQVNQRIDLVGLNEEQKGWLLENLVSVVLDVLLGDTEVELLLMTTEEQKEELRERRAVLQRDLLLCTKRFEQQQCDYIAQLERIEERLTTTK